MALLFGGPEIVTDSLAFVLDPSITRCYPGTGTRITALVANRILAPTYTGVLAPSSVFTTGNYGGITFSPSGAAGAAGSINFQINPSLKMETAGQFTIDVWLKFNSLASATGGDVICSFCQGSLSRFALSNKLFFGYTIGAQSNPANVLSAGYTANDVITTGVVQHLTFTLQSLSTGNFYSNGQLLPFITSGTPMWNLPPDVTNFNPFSIAANGYDSNGSITLYNLKIYNKVLSTNEILQNHNAEKGRYGI